MMTKNIGCFQIFQYFFENSSEKQEKIWQNFKNIRKKVDISFWKMVIFPLPNGIFPIKV